MTRLPSVRRSVVVLTMLTLAPAAATSQPRVEVERLAENVFLYTYNTHRSLFVVTDDGVLATDPQSPEAAERYLQEIRKRTSAPVRYLVYSHHHADHISGGAVFGDEPVVVAQANVPAHLAETDAAIVPPEVTFAEEASIHLGSLEIRLLYPGPSETDSNIIVYVPARRVAFMVDAVTVRALPWRDMASGEPKSWIAALEKLAALDFDILAPGHGPTGKREHVLEYIQYLKDLTAAVQERIDRGETLEQIQASLELPQYRSWTRYDEHFKLNIAGVYRELTRSRR